MKLRLDSGRERLEELLFPLSCLLFLGGTALAVCLIALFSTHTDLAAASAIFAALTFLDAAVLFHLGPDWQRRCIAVFMAAALVYALCLLRAGENWPLWLLPIPVCATPLLGLRRGGLLSLALLVMALFFLPRTAGSVTPLLLYVMMSLAGLLLERLHVNASRRHARQIKTLETLSRTDALTGICNRWWYNEQLKNRSGRPEYRRRYVLLLIDLDHFKSINDVYGHLCGDQVLTDTARIIESTFRKDGIVCRWGGDEFLCQVRAASPEQALAMAEDLRSAIATAPFRSPDGKNMTVTVSIGAVFVPNPQDIYSMELFSMADQALYEAKNNGRNRVSFRITRSPDKEAG